MDIKDMQKAAWDHAENKGFHKVDGAQHPLTRLMLVVTEVVEAAEECRKGVPVNHKYYSGHEPHFKPEGCGIELADVVIRIGDFCATHNIDLDACVVEKLEYNTTRPYLHGKAL